MLTYYERCSVAFITWRKFHKCSRTYPLQVLGVYIFKITITSTRGQYVKAAVSWSNDTRMPIFISPRSAPVVLEHWNNGMTRTHGDSGRLAKALKNTIALINGVNTLRPKQSGGQFPNHIFNENIWISIKISLKFVSKCPSNWQYSSIGSDNGLAPARRQAIIWDNDG